MTTRAFFTKPRAMDRLRSRQHIAPTLRSSWYGGRPGRERAAAYSSTDAGGITLTSFASLMESVAKYVQ
jgi:hypothetical protein